MLTNYNMQFNPAFHSILATSVGVFIFWLGDLPYLVTFDICIVTPRHTCVHFSYSTSHPKGK